jgi:hypothetical protein
MTKRFRSPSNWTIRQRLEHYTIPEALTGCWLCWTAPNAYGYPVIWDGHKPMHAHRVSWMVNRGPIRRGLHVLHRCDNIGCINPDHLFLGTQADNNADKQRKGRQSKGVSHGDAIGRGEASCRATITEETARLIFSYPASQFATAKVFGVSRSLVRWIRERRTWRHIHGDING